MTKRRRRKKGPDIPTYGRSQHEVNRDHLSETYQTGDIPDVPLGNTDPTNIWGTLYGGMPNRSREALGPIRQQRGKYT